jgi:hypothetical protein
MECPKKKHVEKIKGPHGEDYGTQETFLECIKEKCAWWSFRNDRNGQPDNGCALRLLAEK